MQKSRGDNSENYAISAASRKPLLCNEFGEGAGAKPEFAHPDGAKISGPMPIWCDILTQGHSGMLRRVIPQVSDFRGYRTWPVVLREMRLSVCFINI
jgi:hypothetical protein